MSNYQSEIKLKFYGSALLRAIQTFCWVFIKIKRRLEISKVNKFLALNIKIKIFTNHNAVKYLRQLLIN